MSIDAGTGVANRSKGVDRHTSGDLEAWGGIMSGHVSDWSEALDTTPEAFLKACESVELLVDTAEQNNQKDRDRPTDPALRCVAMMKKQAETVAARVGEMDASAESG